MADPAHTYSEPHRAALRLQQLGVDAEQIRRAVMVGLAARRTATRFHPPTYGGYVQWAETHRGLREELVPLSWEPDDAGGFSTVINPSGAVSITVATGTDRTGLNGYPEPTSKYPRGPLTQAAVKANQLVIPGFPGIAGEVERLRRSGCVTWVLLVHTRHNEVRMELSCPDHIGDDDRVDSWSERILIGSVDVPPMLALLDGGDDDDPGPVGGIEVPVEPR